MLTRFVTAGSVDDGKSTLIGRLLWDTRAVFEDQIVAISAASERRGQAQPDLSLLTDGLMAEREQGITIDVAYRYFNTAQRKFIVADCPGHEQYTRNMVTGASNADVAVLLVDARKGLLPQTHRHAAVCGWLGLKRIVLAVNKIDLVDWSQARFEEIAREFSAWCEPLGLPEVIAVPVSALTGDGVVFRGDQMPWYQGPTLLEILERPLANERNGVIDSGAAALPLRFPVQWVIRGALEIDPDFRGFAGRIEAGTVHVGDEVLVQRDQATQRARVAQICLGDQRLMMAQAGRSVTLRLDREVDVSRGDWLVSASANQQPVLVEDLVAQICWFSDQPMRAGDRFLLKMGTRSVRAEVGAIEALIDVESLLPQPVAAEPDSSQGSQQGSVQANDLAKVHFALHEPLPVDWVDPNERLGVGSRLLLIDEATDITVGAGVLRR